MKKDRIYVPKENLDKLSEETLEKLRSGELHLCIGYEDEEPFKEVEERLTSWDDFNKYSPEIKEALMKIFKEAQPFVLSDPIND